MTSSFIAIRGNYSGKTTDIFAMLGYKDPGQDKQFDEWDEFNSYLADNYYDFAKRDIALRGIWFDNGWTIIHDPELVDTVDEDLLLDLSRELKTDIITFIIQTTSGSFGFTFYNDTIVRHFFVSGDEVIDLHPPLLQEEGLNINENIFTDDITGLAAKFGIDLEGNINTIYTVKPLEYGDERKKELERFRQHEEQDDKPQKKPWWKIW